MQEIWVFLKILEILSGLICLFLHIKGFLNMEPLPHNLLFCGSFFGIPFQSLISCIAIILGLPTRPMLEFIVNFLGFFFYIWASMYGMQLAENDFHLVFLTNYEESEHDFFIYCKQQSAMALFTSIIHLLHAAFALDAAVLRTYKKSFIVIGDTIEECSDPAMQPIEVFFLGKPVHKYLMKNVPFFERLATMDPGIQRTVKVIPPSNYNRKAFRKSSQHAALFYRQSNQNQYKSLAELRNESRRKPTITTNQDLNDDLDLLESKGSGTSTNYDTAVEDISEIGNIHSDSEGSKPVNIKSDAEESQPLNINSDAEESQPLNIKSDAEVSKLLNISSDAEESEQLNISTGAEESNPAITNSDAEESSPAITNSDAEESSSAIINTDAKEKKPAKRTRFQNISSTSETSDDELPARAKNTEETKKPKTLKKKRRK